MGFFDVVLILAIIYWLVHEHNTPVHFDCSDCECDCEEGDLLEISWCDNCASNNITVIKHYNDDSLSTQVVCRDCDHSFAETVKKDLNGVNS